MIEPHCQMTAETVAEYDVVLCVGDTTFLDYGNIAAKKEGYGPIGKGGNGLILFSNSIACIDCLIRLLAIALPESDRRGIIF
ncbi:hypothetical protein [Nostoc sp. UHCC 0252]|uniref:hypothetical protein n=1 Tax=Nostoc sp. UHCC 0252 TaxID=3110241 RepID=UPI002B1FFA65|nr:hypothetical protein [Nostoc sp. UHCC 0252]MEA5602839.1 hypothetical protein [Nostoc sp. UHCC 0252]